MGDESQRKYDVFISYSTRDKQWADAACAVLERHRIRCWIAPRDITPGTEWGASIISGMDASKVMVLIFSAHANESAQVRREVERAIGKGLIVLPFRVENVNPVGAMEYALSNTHWLDGFTPPMEQKLDFLANSVQALRGEDRGGVDQRATPPATTASLTPPPPSPRRHALLLLLVALGASVLTLMIVAGLFVMFRGRTAASIDEAAPQTDQDRVQGRWQVVDAVRKSGRPTTKQLAASRETWAFTGSSLTARRVVDGEEQVSARGSFRLHSEGGRKLFDFSGERPDGNPLEWHGDYKFEGPYFKVVVRHMHDPDEPEPADPFAIGPEIRGFYSKFTRVGR